MFAKFNTNIPIYKQVKEDIELSIIRGQKSVGEKLESVRELALKYGVNPSTIQKALSELERTGLILTKRTVGKFITEDSNMIKAIRLSRSIEEVREFIFKMYELGNNEEEILDLINQNKEKRDRNNV